MCMYSSPKISLFHLNQLGIRIMILIIIKLTMILGLPREEEREEREVWAATQYVYQSTPQHRHEHHNSILTRLICIRARINTQNNINSFETQRRMDDGMDCSR